LRRLSERFGNRLPEDQITRFIDRRAEVAAFARWMLETGRA
jgi:hypothetical protein